MQTIVITRPVQKLGGKPGVQVGQSHCTRHSHAGAAGHGGDAGHWYLAAPAAAPIFATSNRLCHKEGNETSGSMEGRNESTRL